MNTTAIKSNWNIAKGKLKQKYAQLTDDDLRFEEGKEQELFGRLQKRTGQSRESLETFLRDECDCDFSASSSRRPWESASQSTPENRGSSGTQRAKLPSGSTPSSE